ncbi:hypothetical protein CkaCkLH20_05338 [Colletotrichum karsti]|uniref:Uncharacterized protein n=1 Tax=Colletotrichum karsti TaxID=1095194 RepID=A0A9P6I7A8_9PEZI|nr:uncharacterized protein CkaCkLH20_05338 [Colletotrichum karsti]KAF9877072.1 hypothetical protein CkaCkLH20_05338 [Colletotrichum karsti]
MSVSMSASLSPRYSPRHLSGNGSPADDEAIGDDDDSLLFSEEPDGWKSMTSSIKNHVYFGGRRYHRYRDGKYLLPNDHIEQEREIVKHDLISLLIEGRLFVAPIGDRPQRILDLGTGVGTWAIDGSELQNRQESQFRRYGRVGLRIARYAAGPTLGFGFWGLVDDCKDMSEKEDKVASGVKCVIGSIGTAMGAGLTLHDGWIKVQEYWGKVNAVGLYYLNDGAGVVKRDLELLEEKMSSALRSEVRHIGNWDGTSIGDVFKRDDENTTYPVFGATMNGMDLHFTVTGGEGNRTNFRIGYGPGPDTDKNTQRLRRRNVQYNKQYFSKGGLDFKVEQTHLDKDHVFMVPERQDDFDWLYEQVECYMTNHAGFGSMPISNPLADFLQTLLSDIKGLNYQVLNTLAKNTIAAGAIAPFGADTPSMIGEMGVDYGIVPDPSCTTELYKRGTLI